MSYASMTGSATNGSPVEPDTSSDNSRIDSTVDKEESLLFEFAQELHNSGDYGRAITEYRRLLSYYRDSPNRPNVKCLLLRCYFESAMYGTAVRFGEEILDTGASPYADEIKFYVGAANLKTGDYPRAHQFLGNLAAGGGQFREKAVMVQGLTYAYELDWEAAHGTFASIREGSEFSSNARYCARLCRRGASLKYKDPVIAGVAAIVPGLGYLYDGYHRTALSALLINGLFIWGIYEAFHNDHPGLGVTLALFEFGWYAGSIYGSVSSAARRNAKMRHDLLVRFDIGFQL